MSALRVLQSFVWESRGFGGAVAVANSFFLNCHVLFTPSLRKERCFLNKLKWQIFALKYLQSKFMGLTRLLVVQKSRTNGCFTWLISSMGHALWIHGSFRVWTVHMVSVTNLVLFEWKYRNFVLSYLKKNNVWWNIIRRMGTKSERSMLKSMWCWVNVF